MSGQKQGRNVRGRPDFSRTLLLFKHNSTEQDQIASYMRGELREYLRDPIVDVGCGTGEVAYKGLSDLRVTLLDCDVVPQWVMPGHVVLTEDFWNLSEKDAGRWRTGLFSHSLQYLDDELDELIAQIRMLRLQRVVLVRNLTSPIFGFVAEWLERQGLHSNPELERYHWPTSWTLCTQKVFPSEFACGSWTELARQFCGVVMDVWPDEDRIESLGRELARLNREPRLAWDQVVEVIDVVG